MSSPHVSVPEAALSTHLELGSVGGKAKSARVIEQPLELGLHGVGMWIRHPSW